MKELFELSNFKSASEIDHLVPNKSGLYCIKIRDNASLPRAFQEAMTKKDHQFVYIGIASQSLKKRMLNQELRAKGHGTFFRSIGAALGYLPPFHSLKDKKNKRNYTFSDQVEREIISWINKNLEVNWVCLDENINENETKLIMHYQPLFNLTKNPTKFRVLSQLRKKCVDHANGILVD